MHILITGAMGFIGRRLLEHLKGRHMVYALARAQDLAGVPADVIPIPQDLTEPLCRTRLPESIDAVIHLAQSDFYRAFPERADDMVAVNVESTVRMLDYAREAGARSFVAASTGGVYGQGPRPFHETDPVAPPDFYTATRRSAELLIAPYRQFFRTVIFRFFFVYGPGQRGMLIPTLMGRLLRGETITVQGNPGLRVNPIHVLDVVRAFEPALDVEESGIFNIAGDESLTISELVELMSDVSGKRAIIAHSEAVLQGDVVGSNERVKSVLDVQPRILLREGLTGVADEMAERMREQDRG